MPTSWEALGALANMVTALVVVVTALIAYRQIRLSADELEHLRSATQLSGTLEIYAELDSAEFRKACLFVVNDLAMQMRDPAFREEASQPVAFMDEARHPEFHVARVFEKVGTYARHRLLDPVLLADNCGPLIRETWQALDKTGWFDLRRRRSIYAYENYEFLYDAAMQWYENEAPPFRTSRRRPQAAP